MAKDILEGMDEMFADSAAVSQPEPQAQPEPVRTDPPPTPTPESNEQPRAADGKFAPKEQVQPTPAPAAAVQPVEKPRVDPEQFKGYLDERDKRKALERELNELKSKQVTPAPVPSFQTDPDAYAAYNQQLVAQTRTNTIFDVSETMAREKHGDAPVEQAMEWAMTRAQQSPAFAAEYLKQKHPIDWAVKQQKRDFTMNEVGDDVEAFVRRKAVELGIIAAAPQPQAAQLSQAASPQLAAQPAPQVQMPPRSIATATAAGGGANVVPPAGEFAMADELFNR